MVACVDVAYGLFFDTHFMKENERSCSKQNKIYTEIIKSVGLIGYLSPSHSILSVFSQVDCCLPAKPCSWPLRYFCSLHPFCLPVMASFSRLSHLLMWILYFMEIKLVQSFLIIRSSDFTSRQRYWRDHNCSAFLFYVIEYCTSLR